jgi:hypothetical protein
MTDNEVAATAKILKDLHEQKQIEGRAAGKHASFLLPPT